LQQALRHAPQFSGRFFKNPQNPEAVQYQPKSENPILSTENIPILCFARETNRVGGTEMDGMADAIWNMAAVIEAFGLQHLRSLQYDPLIVLDMEPPPANPALSADYCVGWAKAIVEEADERCRSVVGTLRPVTIRAASFAIVKL
jgi:hypothetical protein